MEYLHKIIQVGLFLLVFGFVVGGCYSRFPIADQETIARAPDLLIDARAFPSDWQVFPCQPHCDRAERPHLADRSFGIPEKPGHVIQEVWRLSSELVAEDKYRRNAEVAFGLRTPPDVTFTAPSEVTYQSSIADEYQFGCGVHKLPACKALFRYGQYVVELYIQLDTGEGYGLSLDAIEPILRAIDAQAALQLGLPNPTPVR